MNPVTFCDFNDALHLMQHGTQHLFITGKAGTGKSTLLAHYSTICARKPVILAPTGVAALNVGGQTVHSFFKFFPDMTLEKIRRREVEPEDPELYRKLHTIIIDEVSMMRADVLDCVDEFLQIYGRVPDAPFGGVRMIFIGDLYQLPPVVPPRERSIFRGHYMTPYFFSAHVMQAIDLEMVELGKVYRQTDTAFIELLNRIRNNLVTDGDIEQLNARCLDDETHDETQAKESALMIHLTTTNKRAGAINQTHLDALTGKGYTSHAIIGEQVEQDVYPTSHMLHFKIGAQIMMLNNDTRRRWVNGSLGVVRDVRHDENGEEYVLVQIEEQDDLVAVFMHHWDIFNFTLEDDVITAAPVGQFTQYPFRLAWAVTIHKSQGKTFDTVVIDMDKGAFASGQTYVALSRCRSLSGIWLNTPISRKDIRCDWRVQRYMVAYLCQEADKLQSPAEKRTLLEAAIAQQDRVQITYVKASDPECMVRVIRPLMLGEQHYKQHGFEGVRAYCELRQEERTFRLERVLKVEAL